MENKEILATWLYNNVKEFEGKEITERLIFSFLVDFEDSGFLKEKLNAKNVKDEVKDGK